MQDAGAGDGAGGDNQRAAAGAALGVEVLANHVRVAPQYLLAVITLTPTLTLTLTPTLALTLSLTQVLARGAAPRGLPARPEGAAHRVRPALAPAARAGEA